MPYYADNGPMDPMWRYRQLERLGSTAMQMMQVSEQRKQRELERLDRRIQLATAAVAAGGDIQQPAIQSVLNEMRMADGRRHFKDEGLGKQADLLESAWNAASRGPQAMADRAQQAVVGEFQDIMQSYQVGQGTGPGINAGMPKPAPIDAYRQAVQESPMGGQHVAALAARAPGTTLAALAPPEVEEPPKPPGPTEAQRTREYNLAARGGMKSITRTTPEAQWKSSS